MAVVKNPNSAYHSLLWPSFLPLPVRFNFHNWGLVNYSMLVKMTVLFFKLFNVIVYSLRGVLWLHRSLLSLLTRPCHVNAFRKYREGQNLPWHTQKTRRKWYYFGHMRIEGPWLCSIFNGTENSWLIANFPPTDDFNWTRKGQWRNNPFCHLIQFFGHTIKGTQSLMLQ